MMVPMNLPRLFCGLAVALLAGLAFFNIGMNSVYSFGSTVQDETTFATIMWKSGWWLKEAPVLGDSSFFYKHISPIHYLPNLISYFSPWDRITYVSLVYGTFMFAFAWFAYRLIEPLVPGRKAGPYIAAFMTFLLLCSQSVYSDSWELHMELMSPLFALLAFHAWQLRAYRWALLWLLMNAAIREDIGAIYAVVLALLAGAQYLMLRSENPVLAKEKIRAAAWLVGISIGYTALAFIVQLTFFPGAADILNNEQYFTKENTFSHLTGDLLAGRLHVIAFERTGIWLPLVALAFGAFLLKNPALLAGALGLLPYWLINFFSKLDLAATMDTYRPFPFILILLWPALMAIDQPAVQRWRYFLLQWVVLACGMAHMNAFVIDEQQKRWTRAPLTYNAEIYRQFSLDLEILQQRKRIRASRGVLALYPYQFNVWHQVNIQDFNPADLPHIDVLLWFQGDRDQEQIDQLLVMGKFSPPILVPGTKIRMAFK